MVFFPFILNFFFYITSELNLIPFCSMSLDIVLFLTLLFSVPRRMDASTL